MVTEIIGAQNALEGLATQIEQTAPPSIRFNEHYLSGWNAIPFTSADLTDRIRQISARLGAIADPSGSPALVRKLKVFPDQIAFFQSNTLPNLSGGNLPVVVTNLDILMSSIEGLIPSTPLPDWEEVAGSNLIPRDLAKRLRNLESSLGRLEPKIGPLDEKLKAIADAHSAALDLPTDLASLREARDEIVDYSDDAATASSEIEEAKKQSEAARNKIAALELEAMGQIAKIDSAYSAATTAGLAAAFSERAKTLTESTRWWVGLLSFALIGGAVIGYVRLDSFQDLVARPSVDRQIVWINAVMSLLSIAAPVWFAWLATRQISQRFRLAEDYAFKASVARAYEGYRKEASRLDPALEARLFASALDRLEEAPLRFVSTEEHGSPYESLFASTGFQKALDKFPNLRDAMSEALARAAPAAPAALSSTKSRSRSPADAEDE